MRHLSNPFGRFGRPGQPGRLAARRAAAVAAAGILLAAGLGIAAASASTRAAVASARTAAASVPIDPCAIKFASGDLYVGSFNYAVYRVSQRTGAAASTAPSSPFWQRGNPPRGIAVDRPGNVLVAVSQGVVVVAARTGTFYGKKMVAGHVYPITDAFIGGAHDVQLDPYGNVVIALGGAPATHTNEEIDSQIFAPAERSGTFYGHKMAGGKLYLIAGVLNGGPLSDPCDASAADTARADAAPSATMPAKAVQANLGWSVGTLRFDANGNIILADNGSDSASGPCGGDFDGPAQVVVIPARTGTYYGQRMTVGDIYSIAGLGGKTGNGVPAVDSEFYAVTAVALDRAGNILVAALSDGVRVPRLPAGHRGQHRDLLPAEDDQGRHQRADRA